MASQRLLIMGGGGLLAAAMAAGGFRSVTEPSAPSRQPRNDETWREQLAREKQELKDREERYAKYDGAAHDAAEAKRARKAQRRLAARKGPS